MSRRKSIDIEGAGHANPIPAACRIDKLVMSGAILPRDPVSGTVPPDLGAQCAIVFEQMRRIVAAAGGSTDDVIKVNVTLRDPAQRGPVNVEWLKMFPDPDSRPARHTAGADLPQGWLIQLEFTALLP